MGCFAFRSGGKSGGGSSSRSSRPQQHPRPGARTPPAKSAPASTSSSSSSSGAGAGAQSNTKASSASAPAAASSATPTRTIQELSEERGAQRLRVFDLDELGSATNGFSRALKLGEGGFGSVYRAFFRSAAGARVVLAVKRLNQRSLQVRALFVLRFLMPRQSLFCFPFSEDSSGFLITVSRPAIWWNPYRFTE